MRFNRDKVLANARRSDTEDLLHRVTVFRPGMEPEAIEIIEAELASRGVTPEEIIAHHRGLRHQVLLDPAGVAYRCRRCPRPATESEVSWHRLLGLVPLFRQTYYYCDKHWPKKEAAGA
jgi:hypothetical protein